MSTVGLLHPGEMGAALGAQLREAGHEVLWVSSGHSDASTALKMAYAAWTKGWRWEGEMEEIAALREPQER